MNENQPAPVTKEDIHDIIELVQPLAASQKKDILAAIDITKKKIPADQNINDR
jgi:hypothetical protein